MRMTLMLACDELIITPRPLQQCLRYYNSATTQFASASSAAKAEVCYWHHLTSEGKSPLKLPHLDICVRACSPKWSARNLNLGSFHYHEMMRSFKRAR